MLFRLVRPVKQFGSSMNQFVQRIPADVRARAVGLRLAIPLGDFTQIYAITAKAQSVRFSLRTRDPAETKLRQAAATAHLETVWQSLRATTPISLSHKQATALAGDLYRAWANGEEREQTLGITWTPQGWAPHRATPEEDAGAFKSVEIELLPIDAPPHRLRAFTIAPRMVADLSADISRDASTQRRNANAKLHSALMPVYSFNERGGSNVSDNVSDPHKFK